MLIYIVLFYKNVLFLVYIKLIFNIIIYIYIMLNEKYLEIKQIYRKKKKENELIYLIIIIIIIIMI